MFTSVFERILHQKSHADVLNSSLDEYNTDKPNIRTWWNIIKLLMDYQRATNIYSLKLKVHIAIDFSTWPHIKTNLESQPFTINPSRKASPEEDNRKVTRNSIKHIASNLSNYI